MSLSDYPKAAEALMDWFQSQSIAPDDACVVMAWTISMTFKATFNKPEHQQEMVAKFVTMLQANMALKP